MSLPRAHGLLAGEIVSPVEEPQRVYCPAGCEDGYWLARRAGAIVAGQRCETCRGLGWTEADGTPMPDADLLAWARAIGAAV